MKWFKRLCGIYCEDVPKDYWKLEASASELLKEMKRINEKFEKFTEINKEKLPPPIEPYSSIYTALEDINRYQKSITFQEMSHSKNLDIDKVMQAPLQILGRLEKSYIINLYNMISKIKSDIEEQIKNNAVKADEMIKKDERFTKEINTLNK